MKAEKEIKWQHVLQAVENIRLISGDKLANFIKEACTMSYMPLADRIKWSSEHTLSNEGIIYNDRCVLIRDIVCDFYGMNWKEVRPDGKQKFVKPRRIIGYLCSTIAKADDREIAHIVGKNRATVAHHNNLMANNIELYPDIKQEIELLTEKIMKIINDKNAK